MWTYLYPIFSLQLESFTFFLKQVVLLIGNVINHQTVVGNGFYQLKTAKPVRYTIGTGGVSALLLLYNKYLFKDNSALVPLYQGMGGLLGESAKLLRLEGSKLIFEVTKTFSTFRYAAVAGFLEPKHDYVKQILKTVRKK